VIAALDVFIYVGDLTRAIPDAFRILRDGGHLIFSCETAPESGSDLVLQTTQRYVYVNIDHLMSVYDKAHPRQGGGPRTAPRRPPSEK